MHNERCTSGSEGGLEKPTGRKAGRALRSDPTLNPMKRKDKIDNCDAMTMLSSPTALLLTVALLLAACACPARAGDSPDAGHAGDAALSARKLVDEVLRKSGEEGNDPPGAWSRPVIDRALERAGETARRTVSGQQTAPLPAERHAESFSAGRPASAEVLIFTSLSVPIASWRQWAHDAARTGVPLVLRGVGAGGLPATARAIRDRLGDRNAGIAIDPRLFHLFGIRRVPAVVVAPGGVPACGSRGCSNDPPPPHDVIAGNIGLVAALETIAAEGEAGRGIARLLLERMREAQ